MGFCLHDCFYCCCCCCFLFVCFVVGGGGRGLIRVKKISLLDIFRIISVMCKTFSRACSQPGFSLDFAVSLLTLAAPTLL